MASPISRSDFPGKRPLRVAIVAGEASADQHGAYLVRELKRRQPAIRVHGIGGRAMQAAGVEILFSAETLAVVGVTEVLTKTGHLLKAMTAMKNLLAEFNPDLLILIDFPDFNLHLATTAKRAGIPILYYISPQIWAWRPQRIKKIKMLVDHMAVILPFELEFYAHKQVPVSFVGHPLMDSLTGLAAPPPAGQRPPLIALLPGSRDSEVSRLLPTMLLAARRLRQRFGTLNFIVSRASTIAPALLQSIIEQMPIDHLEVSDKPVHEILARSRMAIAASGTVTLEAAITETPLIIIYKVSALSYLLGRLLIDVEHIGLVNLIAKRRLVPELIQHAANADSIAAQADVLLSDQVAFKQMCEGLKEVRLKLGQAGASRRVADLAFWLMERHNAF